MPEKTRRIGPRSNPVALAKLDQRTREAALIRDTRRSLLAHLGCAPSATERALIERITMLTIHVALYDAKALAAGGLDDGDSRRYLAFSNSLGRALKQLGLKGAAQRGPTLAEHLARRAAEREQGADPGPAAA